jgi:spermidine synthase
MLQVALTRIFSVMLWSHYTFLAISIALLGFGAAGSYLSLQRSEHSESELRRLLARSSLLFGAVAVVSVLLVTRLDLETTHIFRPSGIFKMAGMYILAALPFFFAGLAICRMLSAYRSQVNTIYFADLTGAGFGALGVTLLLDGIGAPATILVACTLAAGASLLFAGSERHWSGIAGALGFAALSVVVATLDPWTVPVARSKALATEKRAVVDTRWSLHGRIDVLESTERPLSFGSGVSRQLYDRHADYRTFYMDGSNPSRMIRYDQDLWFLQRLLTAAPYNLGLEKPAVLIIGSGGGIDTMAALQYGARSVTAVEINPVTVELVRSHYADYVGHIFDNPKVRLVAREGRHFLTVDDSRYDLIRLTGVDTRAAAAIGANSMDHVYLYTRQAIRDLYSHLSENGIVAISRPDGWQSLRLVNVMLEELATDDAECVAECLVVLSNGRWNDHLLRRRPYLPEEVEALRSWAKDSKLQVLYPHQPGNARKASYDKLLGPSAKERKSFVENHRRDLLAVTDDRPFFFERFSLGSVLESLIRFDFKSVKQSAFPPLIMAFLQAIVLGVFFILYPLWRNRAGAEPADRRWWTLGYFSLLGLGFILTEMVFIQKYMILLGGPAYAMSVTLFAILVFGGLGAFTARHLAITSPRVVVVAPVAVVVMLALSAWFLERGMPELLGFGFSARVALGIATLAPVSFTLGLPFPVGIRILDARAPQLISWAWACNGCLSVVGSVLGVMISMEWGFSTTLAVAAGCYVIGAVCLGLMVSGRSVSSQAVP